MEHTGKDRHSVARKQVEADRTRRRADCADTHAESEGNAVSVDNRYPLEIWISSDGCKTWERKLGVGAPKGNCSYPDGIYDGGSGHLLFSFELDRKDIYFADCEIPE